MRDAVLLGARLLLGGYMGIHASQKLLGKFHGPGLETISKVFEDNGMTPGREMALAASATEIAGGVLTVTGIADPVGPLAVAGAMTVAAAFNRERGLMAARNGVELPVVYATLALTLAATGAGKYKIGPSVPGRLAAVGALVGGVAAGALVARMVTSKPAPVEAGSAESATAESATAESTTVESTTAKPAAAPPAES
jgi:putative oxidoreductase